MTLDFSRCRNVWVPDDSEAGGFWSPPPPHVREGVETLVKNPWFMLADDVGGMKTAQTIIAAQFLHDAGAIDRVIVVAPASVRPKVWFDRDLGQLADQVFEDKANLVSEYHQKIRQWRHGPEDKPPLRWIVTNYEFIRKEENLAGLLPYCGPKTLLILDESSYVRTWDSAQTSACMRLRWKVNKRGKPVLGVARCGWIWELNGTPEAESALDMFSQGNLLHPSILDCKYVSHFKARYAIMEPVLGPRGRPLESPYPKRTRQPDGSVKVEATHISQVAGWTNLEDLQERFRPYILRREAKSLGIDFALPPVGLDVTLTAATWKAYCGMRDDLLVWLESGVATAATAAVKGMRLAQITSGFLGGIEDSGLDADAPWIGEPQGEALAPELAAMIDAMEEGNGTAWTSDDLEQAKLNLEGAYGTPALVAPYTAISKIRGDVVEVGREKLDFALELQARLLRADSDLKLLTWCRFVPELRRYLREVQKRFRHPVGAACGEKVLMNADSAKKEREDAMRLLHPRTSPPGAITVGATQGTGGIGNNFTACHTVLDMSYDFSAFKKRQGDGRTNRPGQRHKVSTFYLVAVGPKGQKTIDHHIMLTRLGKMNVIDWTVAAWVRALKEE